MEQPEPLAEASPEANIAEPIPIPRPLNRIRESEASKAERDPVDDLEVGVRDPEDALLGAVPLGIEDAGEIALAPVVVGPPRPGDQLSYRGYLRPSRRP